MSARYRITVLPGDGIGPEVTQAALHVLAAAAEAFGFAVDLTEQPFGGAAIDDTGHPFPDATREACLAPTPCCSAPSAARAGTTARCGPSRASSRSALVLAFANLRPAAATRAARPARCATSSSPVSTSLIVRELIGGIYFGDRGLATRPPTTRALHAFEIRRIVERACGIADRRSGRAHERRQGQRARHLASSGAASRRGVPRATRT